MFLKPEILYTYFYKTYVTREWTVVAQEWRLACVELIKYALENSLKCNSSVTSLAHLDF
jgi:hypothetical protein